ncbi:transaldolase [Cellulophaga fucicola]|uniref:transaldolase n=1 Tax=Cellulophaga fucicola TaxID=76595 RepID=UPI003EB74617
MNKFLLFLSITFLFSCGENQKNSPYIYFAGEIVNPKNDSVILYKDDRKVCSSKLDSNNRFAFELDSSAEEGLYHFGHEEVQYIYLEKGDSLLIRVNTVDFDESLVFDGKGQEINNFLLEMFLTHEDEELNIVEKMYFLNPNEFSKKVDSLHDKKIDLLNTLKTEASLTDNAVRIAKTGIDYTTYLYKEKYPFKHRRAVKEKALMQPPEGFYNYRKELTYNNPNYTYITPYYNFMKQHFGGMSYINCKEGCEVNGSFYINQLHFNEHQLTLIDSMVGEKNLKDNLIRNVALNYLLRSDDTYENNTIFMKDLHKVASNNKHIGEIDSLYKSIKNLQPNLVLPKIYIHNVDGEKKSLEDISKAHKNVVFYFWMGENNVHFRHITNRVNQLKENPNNKYTYIGISLRTDEKNWKDIVKSNNLDQKTQYRAEDLKKLNNILIINGKLNRAVITDNGKIIDGFANIYGNYDK